MMFKQQRKESEKAFGTTTIGQVESIKEEIVVTCDYCGEQRKKSEVKRRTWYGENDDFEIMDICEGCLEYGE